MHARVRPATAADAAALAGLRWRRLTEEGGYTGTDREAFLEAFSAWIADHLSTHLPFLAEVDDETVRMAPGFWWPTGYPLRRGDIGAAATSSRCT